MRERASGVGLAIWLLGVFTGLLLALIGRELWPVSADPDVEHYRAVRDFAREAFVREVTDEELLSSALRGMVGDLDTYSRYYDTAESTELDRETVGRFPGIGAIFRRFGDEQRVLFTLSRSPARESGLRVGDTLLTIDGRDVLAMDNETFSEALRPAGADHFEARVRGLDGEVRVLRVEPATLVDPSVRQVRILDQSRGVGYVSVHSFSRETDEEFDLAFAFLRERGMRALVLDLRGNLGGVLDSAVHIAQRFVAQGEIVRTEGRGAPLVYAASAGEARYLGTPLVVLVDQDSASASEVLAGALQDHRVAVVCGSPTYGKGMVQTIRRFERYGTRAKVTSAYYYSPSRRNFERTATPGKGYGILPDIQVDVPEQEARAIHAFLARYAPPLDAVPAIEAWEQQESVQLLDPLPPDAALSTALSLLSGRRPGATLSR